MKNKFIKAVDEMNTVVIQDIGAIVKVGNKYSFNHFLKFNDGRFSKYIQNNEGISKDEADNKVKLWVDEIKDQLNKKGEYSLEPAGILIKESENKYSFQDKEMFKNKAVEIKDVESPTESDVELPVYEGGYLSIHFNVKRSKDEIKRIKKLDELHAFIKDDLRSTIIEAAEKQKKKIERSESISTNVAPQKEVQKPKKEDIVNDKIDPEVKEQVENESKILEVIKEKEEAEAKNEHLDKKSPTKFKIDKQAEPQEDKNKKPKTNDSKRAKKIIILALVLIVAGGSIVGVLKFDMLQKSFFNGDDIADHKTDHETPVNPVDSELDSEVDTEEIESNHVKETQDDVVQETEPVDTTEKTDLTISEAPIENKDENVIETDHQTDSGNYHPVVGSFKVASNADNLVEKLIEEGFSKASIIKDDFDYYYVKLGSYATRKEANEVLNDSKLEGWVKKM